MATGVQAEICQNCAATIVALERARVLKEASLETPDLPIAARSPEAQLSFWQGYYIAATEISSGKSGKGAIRHANKALEKIRSGTTPQF